MNKFIKLFLILLFFTIRESKGQWENDGSGDDEFEEEEEESSGSSPDSQGEVVSNPTPTPKKIDYAKLDLNTDLLRGSRWAIEQKKTNQLIHVYHAIEVVDISKVDVDTMSIRVEIHLRQRWEAEELRLPLGLFKDSDAPDVFIQVNAPILDSLWSPDSYIPLARDTKVASVSTQQSIVNIFMNKTIVFKARLYTILGCLFDFQWYPLDRQDCYLTIESYTQPDSAVRYLWETNQEPVVYSNLKLLQYSLKLPMEYSNGSSPRWGRGEQFAFISLKFSFERQLGHHVIQVFIPTTLVVVLSWFSFWLGLDAVPGRISLLITCMLTLVTMHSATKGSIPPVNYIKMMDIWMVGCIFFVFMALCEFVIVKYIHWRKQQELKAAETKEKEMKEYLSKVKEIEEHSNKGQSEMNNPYLEFYRNMNLQEKGVRQAWPDIAGPLVPSSGLWPYPQNPQMMGPSKKPLWVVIDGVSRFLFPLVFAAFNACFWPWLLIGAANQ